MAVEIKSASIESIKAGCAISESDFLEVRPERSHSALVSITEFGETSSIYLRREDLKDLCKALMQLYEQMTED